MRRLIRRANLFTASTIGPATIRDGALLCVDGRISWIGRENDLPTIQGEVEVIDAEGGWVTPGLIDPHTHLVYGGNRSGEFSQRLLGATYESIAANGGGILSTVHATRSTDSDSLFASARRRVETMKANGVTTVEVKSGYGLDLTTERRMLHVARALESEDVSIVTSYLGAHAIPPEYSEDRRAYLDLVIDTVLPELVAEGLVDAVDGFCEAFAFTDVELERLFERATQLNLPVRLHCEQRSRCGGAQLAARHGAICADHLEWLDDSGAMALAASGTVAVLLPSAFYFLRDDHLPPVELMRKRGLRIAIGTDCNPGTSPNASILLAMNMACILLGLTAEEALLGVTRHAASALGLSDRGVLAVGYRADMCIWAIEGPDELAYNLGFSPLVRRVHATIGA